MKKLFGLFLIAAIFTTPFAYSFSFKKEACKKACKETLTKCKDDARGDKIKIAACQVSYDKCVKECKK